MENYPDFKDNPDAIRIEVSVEVDLPIGSETNKDAIKDAIDKKLDSLPLQLFASLKEESMLIVSASVRPKGGGNGD